MKRSLIASSGLAAMALLTAACGSGGGAYGAGTPVASASSSPTATATTLMLANSKLGQILADRSGRSLYVFEADTGTTSVCVSAGCVAEWPPFTADGTPQVTAGLAADQLGTTNRPDGRHQVTYHGHPLYYFAGDSQPGSTAGQALNDNGGPWYVVDADGTPVDPS
jgi:predicted lipoprotein with Yx(FWY)xxD motif